MRILLVEDDDILAMVPDEARTKSGCESEIGPSDDMLQDLEQVQYDAILLDLDLSGLEKFILLPQSGTHHSRIPVLIIPTQATKPETWPDDWKKSLKLPDFETALKALIYKRISNNQNELTLGSLRFDTVENRVYIKGKPLNLSARETHILELLIRHPNSILSKQRFHDHLGLTHNAIEVYICRLRKKLAPYGIQVRVIRRVGYLIEAKTPDSHG